MIELNKTEIKFKDKLYGRADELEKLADFYSAMSSVDSSLILVKGVSGMGKSTLIQQFAYRLMDEKVYFIRGKQDLSKNNQPYTTIIQAFNQLIDEWLQDTDENRRRIIELLKQRLGSHNKIILKAFPRLSYLFGHDDVPTDSPHLTFKDRFNEALLSFTNALSYLDQRIIIFLDDLQWADRSTIRFLELWLSEGKASNLFWIGAYRDDEVVGGSWLSDQGLLKNTYEDNVEFIKLNGLSLDIIREMCSDVVNMKEERTIEFSELVLQLTGGNPLFIRESLPFLLEDNVLYFDTNRGEWNYDVSRIRAFDKSSRTLEFIIRKMEALSDEAQELMGIGAAIGSNFNVAVLSAVMEKSYSEIVELLEPSVERRMIESISDPYDSIGTKQYRFSHDKMQNAAYSMLSEEKRKWIHYAIGKTYSSSLGYAAQDRNVYDIVNQFNRCTSYFDTEKERLNLVQMNMQAGKKAKLSSSFDQALNYFNIVIHTIESNKQDWDNQIVFEVYLESGEAAYLKSDFVSSVMFYESALKYAETNLQKAKVHHNFLVMYNGVSDMDAAWKSGVKVLEILGHNFPKKVGKSKVLAQFARIKWHLRKVDSQSLLNRQELVDEEAEQLLLTLMEMIAAAWGKKPEILAYVVLKGFEIVLKYGNTPIGYFAVSGYGAMLGMAFGKIQKGWEYVKLGGQLTEKYDSMIFHGRGNFGVHGTYSHLVLHCKNNLRPLEDAVDFSKGAGDYSIAAYSSIILLENMFAVGVSLDVVEEKARSYYNFLKRTANYDYLSSHKGVVAATRLLTGDAENKDLLISNVNKRINRVNFHHIKYTWSIYNLITSIVLGDRSMASQLVAEMEDNGYNALSSIEILRHIFVGLLKTDEALLNSQPKKKLAWLKNARAEVTKYAKINPDNYAQVVALFNGLIAEIKGQNDKAEKELRAAIAFADQYDFFHYKAVFGERLARLLLRTQQYEKGLLELKNAKNAYAVWGAKYKVQLIESELEKLAPKKLVS